MYTRPYNAQRQVVCLDEARKLWVADVTPPLPVQPGHPAREDYAYEPCGAANLFMTGEMDIYERMGNRRALCKFRCMYTVQP